MRVDWVIVGAGFIGSTMARLIAEEMDRKVLLVERRDHIFHTNSKRV